MKEKALKTQKSNRIYGIIVFILSTISFIWSLLMEHTGKLDFSTNTFYYVLSILLSFSLYLLGVSLILSSSINIKKIHNIDYSNDYCFGVQINICSFSDLYFSNNIQALYIWYVDDEDVIAYRYTLDGTRHEGSMTIGLAKKLFDHPLLDYL